MISHTLVSCLLAAVLFPLQALAMSASPFPFNVEQPDGTPVTLFIRGNEFGHRLEDPAGYTVIKQEPAPQLASDGATTTTSTSGAYVYATKDATTGLLVASDVLVGGSILPASMGIDQHLTPTVNVDLASGPVVGGLTALGVDRRRNGHSDGDHRRAVRTGTVNNLVVMVRWSDSPHSVADLPNVAALSTLFNGATQSVRDVYLANSYNQLTINSVLTGWITVPFTEAAAAAGQSGLTCCTLHDALRNALLQAESAPYNINYKNFDVEQNGAGDGHIDMITFLHSGFGAEWGGSNYDNRIWSHKWTLYNTFTSSTGVSVSNYHISPAMWGTSGSELGHIGVIAHETGHFLGLPDLYDVDSSNDGYGAGLGSYSLMANSWGFDGSQNFPPLMDPWCRLQLNWITPNVITSPGTYSVPQIFNNANGLYKITAGFPAGEYLLIENRQPVGYDGDLRQPIINGAYGVAGGIAIYHVDENANYYTQGFPGQAGWPNNGKHYKIALLQADGLYQLESTTQRGDAGDLWRADVNFNLNDNTVPNTKAYQNSNVYSTGISITVTSGSQQTMTMNVQFSGTPTCSDGIQNQGESGVDCGGPCPACPTCFDGIQNQGESGVDCGGPCAACPTCFDGIQNQGESRVDCGGPCSPCVVATPTPTATTTPTPTPTGNSLGGAVSIAQLSVQQVKVNGKYIARATVRVVDRSGKLVPGAKVAGVIKRTRATELISGLTAKTGTKLGTVTLTCKQSWTAVDNTLTFCVTSVTVPGKSYNARANKVTCVGKSGKIN